MTTGRINIEQSLPHEGDVVWVWSKDNQLYLCSYIKGSLFDRKLTFRNKLSKWFFTIDAQYWMYALPQPPRENKMTTESFREME